MKSVQEIFARILEASKQKKDLQRNYRDALVNLVEYKNVNDELKNLQIKKKQIENAIKSQLSGDIEKMEQLDASLKDDYQLLSDVALSRLIQGEAVAVTDESNNNYEPIFSVKFKKSA